VGRRERCANLTQAQRAVRLGLGLADPLRLQDFKTPRHSVTNMKFNQHTSPEPEINLIPFIDVLLVILIFLMLSTSFSKSAQLSIRLPKAQAAQAATKSPSISLQISASGDFFVQDKLVAHLDKEAKSSSLSSQLGEALLTAGMGSEQAMVVISADAQAQHQWIILALQAAQSAKFDKIAFATDAPPTLAVQNHGPEGSSESGR